MLYKTRAASLIVLSGLCFGLSDQFAQAGTSTPNFPYVRTVAKTGESVPGMPSGWVYSTFATSVINNAGYVAFSSGVRNVATSQPGTALIAEGPSGLTPYLIRANSLPTPVWPGLPAGATIGVNVNINPPVFADNGQIAVVAGVPDANGANADRDAWYTASPATSPPIALDGGLVPGLSEPHVFSGLGNGGTEPSHRMNRNGHVVFKANYTGAEAPQGKTAIFSNVRGVLEPVVRDLDPAPNLPSGQTGRLQGFAQMTIGDSGHIGFAATPTSGHQTLYVLPPQAGAPLIRVVGQFDMLADLPNQSISTPYAQAVTSQGKLCFMATLTNGKQVLGRGSNSADIRVLYATNAAAPGLPTGNILRAPRAWAFNDHGEVAVVSSLVEGVGGTTVTNNTVVYSAFGDSTRLIARSGDHVSGLPAASTINLEDTNKLAFNSQGQVAFMARVLGTTSGLARPNGLFMSDPEGKLFTIAVEGEMFEVGPGDSRQLATIQLVNTVASGDSSAPRWFNERGEVTFRAQFFGPGGVTSGVFSVSVPSPSVVAPLGAVCLSIFARRRRRAS